MISRQRQAAKRAAGVHQTEKALEEIPQLGAILVIKRLDAAAAQKIPDHLWREQHPLAHVFAEEREDEAVEQFLGQPQQFAGPSRKLWIVQPENVIEALANLLIAIIKLTFELAPACPLPLDEAKQKRTARFREQHVAGKKLGEKITVETRVI